MNFQNGKITTSNKLSYDNVKHAKMPELPGILDPSVKRSAHFVRYAWLDLGLYFRRTNNVPTGLARPPGARPASILMRIGT